MEELFWLPRKEKLTETNVFIKSSKFEMLNCWKQILEPKTMQNFFKSERGIKFLTLEAAQKSKIEKSNC